VSSGVLVLVLKEDVALFLGLAGFLLLGLSIEVDAFLEEPLAVERVSSDICLE